MRLGLRRYVGSLKVGVRTGANILNNLMGGLVVRWGGILFHTLGWISLKTNWFSGSEVSENGILICKDFNGRPSGEAYVQLNSVLEAEKALEKNNANMGHRWGQQILTL